MNIINEENLEQFKDYIEKGKTIQELCTIYNCTRSTITNAKKKFGLIGLSPNIKVRSADIKTKVCSLCNQEKDLTEYYSNGYSIAGKKKYKPKCKQCENTTRYSNFNEVLVEYLDSVDRIYACELCGYDKNPAAIEFHHINTREKEYQISSLSRSMSAEKLWEIFSIEIPKCKILCSNCHREWHNPSYNKQGL